MPSQSPDSEREAERRLNIGTLAIASFASAAAALIVSQFSIAGTWIAAAITPVLVALIAELVARPTDRIKGALTSDRTAAFPVGDDPAPRVTDKPEPDPAAPRPGSADAPVRIYRAGAAQPRRSRRKVAMGAVLGTAAIAFVIGALLITVPELIAGQSIGGSDRASTLLGGKSRDRGGTATDAETNTVTVTTPGETEARTVTEEQSQPTETTPPPTTTTTPPSTTTPTPTPQAAPPETTTPTP